MHTTLQVSFVLSSMVNKLQETPSVRLLKHIVRCYLRLSEHQRYLCSFSFLIRVLIGFLQVYSCLLYADVLFYYNAIVSIIFRAREALRQCLPDALKDQTFATAINTEDSVQRWLALLIKNLNDPNSVGITSAPAGAATGAASGAQAGSATGAGAGGVPGGASKTAAVNLPTIPSGSSGAFGYSSVPLASANWNS